MGVNQVSYWVWPGQLIFNPLRDHTSLSVVKKLSALPYRLAQDYYPFCFFAFSWLFNVHESVATIRGFSYDFVSQTGLELDLSEVLMDLIWVFCFIDILTVY